MAVHTIRLREPWEKHYDSHGNLQLLRSFNAPTGLGEQEKIFLTVETLGVLASITVNRHPLGQIAASGAPFRAELTGSLRARNQICIAAVVSAESPLASGLTPNVRLEIESS